MWRCAKDDGKSHLPIVPCALPLFPFPRLRTAKACTIKAPQKEASVERKGGHMNSSCIVKYYFNLFSSWRNKFSLLFAKNSRFCSKHSDRCFCWFPAAGGHQHGVSIWQFFSQILDFIYWTVLIFILINLDWRDSNNQQLGGKCKWR